VLLADGWFHLGRLGSYEWLREFGRFEFRRLPVHCHVPGKLGVNRSDKTRPGSHHLLVQILPVLAFRLVPPHVPKRSGYGRWIGFFERPNLNDFPISHHTTLPGNAPNSGVLSVGILQQLRRTQTRSTRCGERRAAQTSGGLRALLNGLAGRWGGLSEHPYLSITSRAKWLATTSRKSDRLFPASIMASREP